jgi:hypothetical protein
LAVSKAFEPNEATQARGEISVFGRFDLARQARMRSADCLADRPTKPALSHLFLCMSCAIMAETEGFEPSIELYNPITV